MAMTLSRWNPSADVRSHTGGLIPPGSVFFAPPPAAIGTVLSAQCGLRAAGSAVARPIARKVVGLFLFFGALVGGLIGGGVAHFHWIAVVVGILLGALLIGGPIYRRERKRDDCTYVGTHGIARFPISSRRRSDPGGEVFLFADAVDLQTAFLGRNSGTNFNFRWKNAQKKVIYKLEGGYYGNQKDIDPDAVVHFATAAEQAWTRYLLPQVTAELQRNGSYQFITRPGISGNQHAVIAPRSLEIVTGAKRFHAPADSIDDVIAHHGYIIIRRKDAQQRAVQSLDGTHGICYLSYGAVSNVKIFLTLLTQVVGVPWRQGE